jgi:hypothetical protein
MAVCCCWFSSGVGGTPAEAQGRLFGLGPEALRRGSSEEMEVRPQHVDVHGGELGRRAMIWDDADLDRWPAMAGAEGADGSLDR